MSTVRFDNWENTAGTLQTSIINVYSTTSTTQQALLQSSYGSGENRGATWFDCPGLSITVTPESTRSRFLIFGHMHLSCQVNSYNVHWRMLRNAVEIGSGETGSGGIPNNEGNQYTWRAMGQWREWTTASSRPCPFNWLDAPQTTSAITYKLQALQTYYPYTWYFNRCIETGWQSGNASTITVMELQS